MLEEILKIDTELFIYLNNLGNSSFDIFWTSLSKLAANVIPYFLLIMFYTIIKRYSKLKYSEVFYLLLVVAIMITISDQSANLFKDSLQRLRPCYNEIIQDSVRLVKENCGGKYGFFSAHASNSFSLAIFFGLLYKQNQQYLILATVIYASLISYSRVYLGVHYPLDIFFGGLFGILNGILFYRCYKFFNKS